MNTQISHPHKKDVSFELDVRYEILSIPPFLWIITSFQRKWDSLVNTNESYEYLRLRRRRAITHHEDVSS